MAPEVTALPGGALAAYRRTVGFVFQRSGGTIRPRTASLDGLKNWARQLSAATAAPIAVTG